MAQTRLDLANRTPSYLVLVPEMLVAHDIALTISDFDAGAVVICARSKGEAVAALYLVSTLEIAFIADCPGVFLGSDLHSHILAKGGRVVMLGVEAERKGPTSVFDVLCQPFDTEAVIAKLRAGHPCFG